MLGTEFFLRNYEQRSRELSLKCLNRCATTDANITMIRDAGIVKPLDAAMRAYATMIIQLQGVLLIKALSKDEGTLLLSSHSSPSLLYFSSHLFLPLQSFANNWFRLALDNF
jgi:hypothetical protein